MSFDGIFFKRAYHFINDKIVGSYINKIGQKNATDFVFYLYKNKEIKQLYVSTNNTGSFFALVEQEERIDNISNHFLSILYHHIVNGKITRVEQINNDRILCISVEKANELGILHRYKLFIELIGKLTNIILCKEDGTIIDALHKISPLASRGIAPGIKYSSPISMELKDPLTDFDDTVSIKDQFSCFSGTLLKEFEYRMDNGQNYSEIIEEIFKSTSIYIYSKDYHLIPLTHIDETPKIMEMNKGLISYNSNRTENKETESIKYLVKVVNRQIKHINSKIDKLEDELTKSESANQFLEYGDLIFGFYSNLDDRKDSISIENDGKIVTIQLDNSITIKENALKFYRKYQKLRNSKAAIEDQINISRENLDYFKFILIQLEDKNAHNIEQIRQELSTRGIINADTVSIKRHNVDNFLHYEFEGFDIFVGRNNYQNEQLTLKKAKFTDYFFHVKDYAGSHVIVSGTKELNESIIRYAANIAAYYSNARESSSVPVDYTVVKNVKRHPSNIPGKVIIKNYKTIYIDPIKI